MVKTGQDAINNTHNKKVIDFIDAVYMVNISSWSYEDAPGELSKKLNITLLRVERPLILLINYSKGSVLTIGLKKNLQNI